MADEAKKTTVIIVPTFSGGLFDDERTSALAHRVIYLSLITAFFLILDQILALADPLTQAALNDDILNVTIYADNYPQEAYVATVYASVALSLGCVLLIPYCGYSGAKSPSNSGTDLLRWFCACSGFCGTCAWIGFVSSVVTIGFGGAQTCATYEDIGQGFDPAVCNVRTALLAIMGFIFCVNTYFSNELIQSRDLVIINPMVPSYATTTVRATPV